MLYIKALRPSDHYFPSDIMNPDRSDEDFECEIYKVEDPVVKESVGALFDQMWGPHGREVVRERSDTVRGQVMFDFCLVC